MKIIKFALKAMCLAFRVLVYPITYIYKYLRRKRTGKRKDGNDFPGIYIVSNSAFSVKIGRSKNVKKRLRAYRGYYYDGRDIPVLLLIKCRDHKKMEHQLHLFATEQGLVRSGRTEVFQCTNHYLFIYKVMWFVKNESGLRSYFMGGSSIQHAVGK